MKRSTQAGIAGGLLAIATAFGVAAFNRRGTSVELERRLALRSDSTALDLALRARDRTQFVSAIERNDAETAPAPLSRPNPQAPVRRPLPVAPEVMRSPSRVAAPAVTEVAAAEPAPQVESTPAPVETPAEAAPAPARTPDHYPAPRPTPTRKGGYWSTGDVIRNAPFPINP